MQALLSIIKAISVAKVLLPQQPPTNIVIENAFVNYIRYLNIHEIMLYNSIAKDIENKKAMATAGDKDKYNNLNEGNAPAHISNVMRELNETLLHNWQIIVINNVSIVISIKMEM